MIHLIGSSGAGSLHRPLRAHGRAQLRPPRGAQHGGGHERRDPQADPGADVSVIVVYGVWYMAMVYGIWYIMDMVYSVWYMVYDLNAWVVVKTMVFWVLGAVLC